MSDVAWAFLTPAEREELEQLLAHDMAAVPWRPLAGPQTMARESKADIIGLGGAAGGGKTDSVAGWAVTDHHRTLIVRREKTQTEGIIQRLTEILGSTEGYSSQKSAWHFGDNGKLIEFAGLDNPGDERRWQGRPHDLKAFDEVTEMREQQVRFVMGWLRSSIVGQRQRVLMTFNPPTTDEGRWVIAFFGPWLDPKHPLYPTPPGKLLPAAMIPDDRGGSRDVWLDRMDPFIVVNGQPFYDFDPSTQKPEKIIKPKTRTFIPARVTDNPYYMATDYVSTLQALPEPLRSQMLYGDFQAGVRDDAWQLLPSAWVDAAFARWKPKDRVGEMLTIGADVARGGKDDTVLFPRHYDEQAKHAYYFDAPRIEEGKDTPNGPAVAGLVIAMRRDNAPVAIDVIGVGSSPYDTLKGMNVQVIGINVAEAADATDRTGALRFSNKRSQFMWRVRELLDPANNTGIALPSKAWIKGVLVDGDRLRKELVAPRWYPKGKVVHVESREEIIERVGWSPDMFVALMLAAMDIPKLSVLQAAGMREEALAYNPVQRMHEHQVASAASADEHAFGGHDPFRR